MSSKKIARYVCVPTVFGLFNVVDTTSGLPAEVHATAVLLKRDEAQRLISWLKTRGAEALVLPSRPLQRKKLNNAMPSAGANQKAWTSEFEVSGVRTS
ncbi:hypothetical protein [Rhizobium leguminosarum]|uniref:Uncharacterized protein n=1 Tax=Rhizobium leguminosarum TaxID=384 RepID=A0A2Z4YRR3_RHILE|nr:hypothetical protein [Rhizobium leguminosarum]AXA43015.1 hypothetical protein DLJ82_5454 [Rhizobium leguminosarum]